MKISVTLDLNYNNLSDSDGRLLLRNCLNNGLIFLDKNLNPMQLSKTVNKIENLNFSNLFKINVEFRKEVFELSFNKTENSLTLYSDREYKNIAQFIDITLKITNGLALHSLFSE